MARDPKEWAADVDSYDVINVYSPCEFEVNREGLADLIREAQEDGAKEWRTRSETLVDDNMMMSAEIAKLRERLSDIASLAQHERRDGDTKRGLEAIRRMATEIDD